MRARSTWRDAAKASSGLKDVYLKRGQTLHSSGQYDAAWANYVEMTNAARARGDRAMELAALLESAMLRAVFSPIFDPALARNLCEQALTLAETMGDREAEARVLWVLMRVTVNVGGEPDQAIAYGERALALAHELNLREQLGVLSKRYSIRLHVRGLSTARAGSVE